MLPLSVVVFLEAVLYFFLREAAVFNGVFPERVGSGIPRRVRPPTGPSGAWAIYVQNVKIKEIWRQPEPEI